ncbi:MAG TPA: hypothetical protein VGQ13_01010 [Nitrososphaera sp.]|jgi:hypothetical protein|nr:hypothetical protein [Nitrososphaera sp.]
MRRLPTYGTAGIGIAAAIGFVFALSILSTNSGIINTNLDQSRVEKTTSPSGQEADTNGDASTFAKSGDQSAQPQESLSLTQQERSSLDLRPTFEAMIATDTSRSVSREIVPQMEFEIGKPVLIQAKFANQNDESIKDHAISLSIRAGGGEQGNSSESTEQGQTNEQAADFRGDIAARSNIELELYWNPDKAGDYTILLFSNTQLELAAPEPIKPLTFIPVKVVGAQ